MRRHAASAALLALAALASMPVAGAERRAAVEAPTPLVAVPVKVAEVKGRTRLILQWRQKVGYEIVDNGDDWKIRFDHPAVLDLSHAKAEAAALKPRATKTANAVTLSLSAPEGSTLQHWYSGTTVVIELEPPAGAKTAETARVARAATPQPAPAPAPVAATPPAPAAVPPPPAAAKQKALPVRYTGIDEGGRLRFDWATPVAAAVFRRGADLWIVFDAALPADLGEVKANGRAAVSSIEQLPHPTATVLRLATINGFNPSVARAGNGWAIDLRPQSIAAEAPVAGEPQPATGRVLFRLANPSAPVTVTDPEHGDTLVAVPGGELGQGVARPQSFAEFRVLPTAQGLALVPSADRVTVRAIADGAEVSREGGLALAPESDRKLTRGAGQRLFDLAAWGAGRETYLARRRALQNAIAGAPDNGRTVPRLALARFYFAEGYGPEALGVLDAIERDDAAASSEPGFFALRGAAAVLAGEREVARRALGQHSLDTEPEAALWRGALAASGAEWPEAARQFAKGLGLLNTYPKPLRNRLALGAAEAMLDAGARDAVQPLLRTVMGDAPSPADAAAARFLAGRDLQKAGDIEGAIGFWDEVIAAGDRRAKAHATLARTLALLDSGRLARTDAIKELDGLRFTWRGDELEYTVLRRLGELQLKEGDWRQGFASLTQATDNFPEYASRGSGQLLAETFAELFLGRDADSLSPLKALALFEENRSLLPSGPKGDEIVQKLADRLVGVDLLDRAAALLDDQVKNRLAGKERARVATRLAVVRLLDRKPAEALAALAVEAKEELPPELVEQRRVLKARALGDLGRNEEALAALAGDAGGEAERLRAGIHWKTQNWIEAAKSFQRLTPPDGKLDEAAARDLVNWAAALSLAGDKPGVATLWQKYQVAMEASPSRELFRAIAAQTGNASDMRALASSVAQVNDLQSFMKTYKDRLGGQKLSAREPPAGG
jgi:hypothetical protein